MNSQTIDVESAADSAMESPSEGDGLPVSEQQDGLSIDDAVQGVSKEEVSIEADQEEEKLAAIKQRLEEARESRQGNSE